MGKILIALLVASAVSVVSAQEKPGASPVRDSIFAAVEKDDAAAVSRLLDAGADINELKKRTSHERFTASITPLGRALTLGKINVARLLINRRADVNQTFVIVQESGELTEYPLFAAMMLDDNFVTARAMLEHGANPNIFDFDGNTPLMRALNVVSTGQDLGSSDPHLVFARELLRHGAKVNQQTADGRRPSYVQKSDGTTALHQAVRSGMLGIAAMLVENGADVHMKNRKGQTPVIYGASMSMFGDPRYISLSRKLELVNKLLEWGSDISEKDNDGKSALDYISQSLGADKAEKFIRKIVRPQSPPS